MKKHSYPSAGEVQKLIGVFERRRALREQVKEKNAIVREKQDALRRQLCDFLCVPDESAQPLSHYMALYQRGAVRGRSDSDISAAITKLEPLVKELRELDEQIQKDRGEVRAGANALCAQAATAMRAEYDALIAEIAAALLPWCAGDTSAARSLAEETPAASELKRQWNRCYPAPYTDDDLISPLRAVLEISTANAAKK